MRLDVFALDKRGVGPNRTAYQTHKDTLIEHSLVYRSVTELTKQDFQTDLFLYVTVDEP